MAARKRKRATPPKPRPRNVGSEILAVAVYAGRAVATPVARLALKNGENEKVTFNYDVELLKDRDVAGV